MTTVPRPDPLAVLPAFAVPGGGTARARPLEGGLIHDSFRIEWDGGPLGTAVLQRLAADVFPDPPAIAANLAALRDAWADCPQVPPLPEPIPVREGGWLWRDGTGRYWRMWHWIEGRVCSAPPGAAECTALGEILGRFHRCANRPGPIRFRTTLPGFHHTPGYLRRLDELVAANPLPSTAEGRYLARCIARERASAGRLQQALAAGLVRLRVVHGDPRLDNLLFEPGGSRVVALLDLDTVQPGLIHHDLADALRSACCVQAGEEVDYDTGRAAAILRAWFAVAGDLLSPPERRLLLPALRLLPFELGLRFLSDHLAGDRYFRVSAPGENLQRALVQFRLLDALDARRGELEAALAACG